MKKYILLAFAILAFTSCGDGAGEGAEAIDPDPVYRPGQGPHEITNAAASLPKEVEGAKGTVGADTRFFVAEVNPFVIAPGAKTAFDTGASAYNARQAAIAAGQTPVNYSSNFKIYLIAFGSTHVTYSGASAPSAPNNGKERTKNTCFYDGANGQFEGGLRKGMDSSLCDMALLGTAQIGQNKIGDVTADKIVFQTPDVRYLHGTYSDIYIWLPNNNSTTQPTCLSQFAEKAIDYQSASTYDHIFWQAPVKEVLSHTGTEVFNNLPLYTVNNGKMIPNGTFNSAVGAFPSVVEIYKRRAPIFVNGGTAVTQDFVNGNKKVSTTKFADGCVISPLEGLSMTFI